jgi:hypothetical protein
MGIFRLPQPAASWVEKVSNTCAINSSKPIDRHVLIGYNRFKTIGAVFAGILAVHHQSQHCHLGASSRLSQ